MNIFEQIKSAVSTRDAAIFYGIKVSRNGMCCCPFHPDRHPSMKVDNRFHCFGCGADGDVINFVERMDGLAPIDAAKKLATDFCIPITNTPTTFSPTMKAAIEKQNKEKEQLRAFQLYKRDALNFLREYHRILFRASIDLAPNTPGELENCHPLFEESAHQLVLIADLLEEIENGTLKENIETLSVNKEVINRVKRRIEEINCDTRAY